MQSIIDDHALYVAKHPGTFVLQTLKAFRANQGLLLAGAVAYYALLSIVPLMILIVIALSRFVPQHVLLAALAHLLQWLVPGQSNALVRELANFLAHRAVIGWVLLLTMIFFSSLAFTVLENAMSLIFVHRVVVRRRHFLLSAMLPYCYILFLGVGLLIVTFVSSGLEAIGAEGIDLFGLHVSLQGLSRVVLYLLGLAGEVFVLTSIYMVMPVGRPSLKHALFGGVVAAVLWEITRHVLVWYFRHSLAGQPGVRIADHGHRDPVQPGMAGDAAAARSSGDFAIRTIRPRTDSGAAAGHQDRLSLRRDAVRANLNGKLAAVSLSTNSPPQCQCGLHDTGWPLRNRRAVRNQTTSTPPAASPSLRTAPSARLRAGQHGARQDWGNILLNTSRGARLA